MFCKKKIDAISKAEKDTCLKCDQYLNCKATNYIPQMVNQSEDKTKFDRLVDLSPKYLLDRVNKGYKDIEIVNKSSYNNMIRVYDHLHDIGFDVFTDKSSKSIYYNNDSSYEIYNADITDCNCSDTYFLAPNDGCVAFINTEDNSPCIYNSIMVNNSEFQLCNGSILPVFKGDKIVISKNKSVEIDIRAIYYYIKKRKGNKPIKYILHNMSDTKLPVTQTFNSLEELGSELNRRKKDNKMKFNKDDIREIRSYSTAYMPVKFGEPVLLDIYDDKSIAYRIPTDGYISSDISTGCDASTGCAFYYLSDSERKIWLKNYSYSNDFTIFVKSGMSVYVNKNKNSGHIYYYPLEFRTDRVYFKDDISQTVRDNDKAVIEKVNKTKSTDKTYIDEHYNYLFK